MEAGGSGVGVLWLCCEGGDLVARLLKQGFCAEEVMQIQGLHPEQPGHTVDSDTFEVGGVGGWSGWGSGGGVPAGLMSCTCTWTVLSTRCARVEHLSC